MVGIVQDRTHIGIVLYERFSNHCLANALEPFRAANDLAGRPLYAWHLMTPDGGPVASSSGLPVTPRAALGDAPGGDLLMLLPSYGHLEHRAHARALRAAAGRYGAVAGLDAGAWLMAHAGLLAGRRATIHAELRESFAAAFPEVEVTAARHVRDGARITSGGAMTAFELVLDLIRERHGGALAQAIAALFMADGARGGPADRVVARALGVMEAHVEEPLPVPEVARRAGCTRRALEGRFRRALGETPREIYTRLRLVAARRLLGEGLPVAEVAARTGYMNASAFARAVRREFGVSPSMLR